LFIKETAAEEEEETREYLKRNVCLPTSTDI